MKDIKSVENLNDMFIEAQEKLKKESNEKMMKNLAPYKYEYLLNDIAPEKAKKLEKLVQEINENILINSHETDSLDQLKGMSLNDIEEDVISAAAENIAQQYVDEGGREGLKFLAQQYQGIPAYDLILKRYFLDDRYSYSIIKSIVAPYEDNRISQRNFLVLISNLDPEYVDRHEQDLRKISNYQYEKVLEVVEEPDFYAKKFMVAYCDSCERFDKDPEEKLKFKEKCEQLWQRMVKDKESYISDTPLNFREYYISSYLSGEKIQQAKELFADKEDNPVQRAVSQVIAKRKIVAAVRDGCQGYTNAPFVDEMYTGGITTYTQARRVIDLYWQVSERPDAYNSPYNKYSIEYISKVVSKFNISKEADWMYPVLLKVVNNECLDITSNRQPSERTLFDACKAWKVCSNMPLRLAKKVGQYSLSGRIVAGAVFDKLSKEKNLKTLDWMFDKELQAEFYLTLSQYFKVDRNEALKQLSGFIGKGNRKRLLYDELGKQGFPVENERFKPLFDEYKTKENIGDIIKNNSIVAHKGRFSSDEEFKYALEHFDTKTLSESMIFRGQQRVMNVLFSTYYVETNVEARTRLLRDKIEEKEHEIESLNKEIRDRLKSREQSEESEQEKEIKQQLGQLRKEKSSLEEDTKNLLRILQEEALSFRKPDAAEFVKIYMKNSRDWLIPASFKGAAIFKDYFPAYIKTIQNHNKKNPEDALPVHDAVYWLPEPMNKEANERFAQFIQKNIIYQNAENKDVHRPLNELRIIAQNWKAVENRISQASENDEIVKLKYNDVLSICTSVKYRDQRNDLFAIEAANRKNCVSEAVYHNCEDIYLAGLKVPEPFDSKKEFKDGNYTGRFLSRDDPRTLFFGNYTNCCQHYGGVGHSCAVSTVKHPFSQLFVIEDNKGNIIAGSWTWENTEGKYRDVCFDNIEALGELERRSEINKIYEQVGEYLTKEENCHKVTIGLGYQDADVSRYKATDAIPLPKLYGKDGTNSYSDARSQVLLAENPKAQPLDKNKESQRYIRDVCFLDKEAMDRVSEAVFPDSDKQLQEPDNMAGFVIEDREKGVVGYCLYDSDKKSIYDMAVLPEYRTDENASSRKLFAEMVRVVNRDGGEWSAEMREGTSLRYLKAMAERGLVTYEEHGVDHVMSDGSKVVSVTFRAVSEENQKGIDEKTMIDDTEEKIKKLKGRLGVFDQQRSTTATKATKAGKDKKMSINTKGKENV